MANAGVSVFVQNTYHTITAFSGRRSDENLSRGQIQAVKGPCLTPVIDPDTLQPLCQGQALKRTVLVNAYQC